jgi:hypothetical protein
MSYQVNEPRKPWEWVILFLALLGVIVFAVSCSTPARLNEKAYQRVITDSALHRKAWYAYDRLRPPCTNDTIIGETEVLILSDTTVLPGTTDTIIRPDTIRITTTRTNTVTQYVVDNRAINELTDTIHAYQLRAAAYSGNIAQLSSDRDKQAGRADFEAKRAKRAGWLMWGILAAALLSHLLRSIPSIRKAIGI